jgi:hypothetical protein
MAIGILTVSPKKTAESGPANNQFNESIPISPGVDWSIPWTRNGAHPPVLFRMKDAVGLLFMII